MYVRRMNTGLNQRIVYLSDASSSYSELQHCVNAQLMPAFVLTCDRSNQTLDMLLTVDGKDFPCICCE